MKEKNSDESDYLNKENNINHNSNIDVECYKKAVPAENKLNENIPQNEFQINSDFLKEIRDAKALREKSLNGNSNKKIQPINENLFQKNNTKSILDSYKDWIPSFTQSKTEEATVFKKRRFWDDEEDKILKTLVDIHGDNNWKIVAEGMEHRTAKQCAERWLNHLTPEISHRSFTPEEDEIIISFYFKHGGKWKNLEKLLPNRSTLSLKNRFNSNIKKKLCKEYRCSPDEIESAAGLCRLWNELSKRK